MSETETVMLAKPLTAADEIQRAWPELTLRVAQLEAEMTALEHENKALKSLLERVIEHRQKSHGELVLLLSGLVSKLQINDVGVIVSRLVEHNAHVAEVCAALAKGKAEAAMPQPAVLKALEQKKRYLAAALKPAVEELIQSDPPLETEILNSLITQPESFFSPKAVRASRCFVKGQVPRERIAREFGEAALVLFTDMTTDAKLNPRPKPDEIMLAFKSDFEALLQQNPALLPDKRQDLLALHQKVQRSKAATDQSRAQRNAFNRLSFILELLHYYENQNTETPDVIFAQRLPVLVEQLVLTPGSDTLDEKVVKEAESLLEFIINPDHRHMTINNIGKSGGTAKTLKYVLNLRAEKVLELDLMIMEFLKHLIPLRKTPPPESMTAVLRLIHPDMQRRLVRTIMDSERIPKEDAEVLGKVLAKNLGLTGLETESKAPAAMPVEMERKMAWDRVKELITRRSEPTAIATAIRDRLHARYDAEEVKQSWIILMETDPISLIRIFCQLPYLTDGGTDPLARAVMETYVTRLTHEKYATTYHKVVTSLKNMFKAKPDSPTLQSFISLVKWVDADAARKLALDIGMPV